MTGKQPVWQTTFDQIKATIDPPIYGMLLLEEQKTRLLIVLGQQSTTTAAEQLRALALITLASLTDLDLQPDQIQMELVASQETDAPETVAYLAQNDLKRLFVTLSFLAFCSETRSLNVAALGQALRESTLMQNAMAGLAGWSVINRQGVMIYRYPEAPELDLIGKDYSDRRYFQQAIKGRTYISTVFRAKSNLWVAVVSLPVIGNDGQVVGIVSGGLDLAGVRSFLSVPVIHDYKIKGLITIASPEADAFGEEQLKVISSLAQQITSSSI
ncbi:MAG: GAF domain-containing protein [Moorea sp. SIOASIH]|uniref:GAF domain-containing protein n=1 Tax=Moorena sp. SIOASIH TaxID=2607817 RepID=UPI0013BB3798|nr:GAF domain-containing protein [Moorena sp. SIOASIH]NEO40345.1 GAF domain-containing protein [Moorena sp. SIOASIH]